MRTLHGQATFQGLVVSRESHAAHHLGFAHARAFCYWFRNSTGMTPTGYRIHRAVNCAGDC